MQKQTISNQHTFPRYPVGYRCAFSFFILFCLLVKISIITISAIVLFCLTLIVGSAVAKMLQQLISTSKEVKITSNCIYIILYPNLLSSLID